MRLPELLDFYLVSQRIVKIMFTVHCFSEVWGHPFMTSTRRGRRVRLRWTHVNGEGGQAPCGRPHRKLKLESTYVILSSFPAKKLAYFYQNFVFGRNKK